MPLLVIGSYTVTRDLSFVNILLSLFVIITKTGKVSFSYSTCKFWYHPHSIVIWHAAQQSVPEVRRDNALDAGDCRFSASGTYGEYFSGFKFFLLPNRVHARPSATNAARWGGTLYNRITIRETRGAFRLSLNLQGEAS
jgi:hypothetical protein